MDGGMSKWKERGWMEGGWMEGWDSYDVNICTQQMDQLLVPLLGRAPH